MTYPPLTYLLLLLLTAFLSACNSGTSTATEETIAPKIVSFNKTITTSFSEQNVTDWRPIHNTEITADVVAPNSTSFKYQWVVLSEHSFEFLGLDEPELKFSYQTSLTNEENILIVDLTVTDEHGALDYKSYQYDLNDFVHVETPSQFVEPNQLITLAPVITGKRGKISSYTWQELDGYDNNLTLFYTDDEQLEAQFLTPNVNEITTLYLSLSYTIDDGDKGDTSLHKIMNIHIEPK